MAYHLLLVMAMITLYPHNDKSIPDKYHGIWKLTNAYDVTDGVKQKSNIKSDAYLILSSTKCIMIYGDVVSGICDYDAVIDGDSNGKYKVDLHVKSGLLAEAKKTLLLARIAFSDGVLTMIAFQDPNGAMRPKAENDSLGTVRVSQYSKVR
jgi:hypothetical protein